MEHRGQVTEDDARMPAPQDDQVPKASRPPRTIWLIAALVAAVLLGGGIWLWEDVLQDRIIPKRWGVIVEGVAYRSGQLHPALVERTLRDHRVELVVSLIDLQRADAWDRRADEAEREACRRLDIERRVAPLNGDGTGDLSSYVEAVAALAEAVRQERVVLVHCAAGTQRTGGTVALYRVLVQGWDPQEACAEMARYGWDPDDDAVLLEFLDRNMDELVGGLVRRGVLADRPEPLPHLTP